MPGPRIILTFLFGAFLVALSVFWSSGRKGPHDERNLESDLIGRSAPEIFQGDWINSGPLTLAGLRGRVVLLEFWTYGCYNCRNTIPSMNEWKEMYEGKHLTIIGIHTPEFEREKDLARLRKQVKDLEIEYPVVTDNEFTSWNAYEQRYWPVMYLIDKKGIVRYMHIGEGRYEATRRKVEDLLEED